MAKLFLADRTRQALRSTDSVSPRINQIVDRYLALVAEREHHLRVCFTSEEWAVLVDAAHRVVAEPVAASAARRWIVEQLEDDHPGLARSIDKLVSQTDVLILLELLERDHAGAAAPA